jgi:uncharacterized repeat protein (TIGR03803 family)
MKIKWCVTGFLMSVFCAGIQLHAQTVQTLVSFNGTNGNNPTALTLGNDGNFYGTTVEGGTSYGGYGTVFQVTTNGTLHTLVSFRIGFIVTTEAVFDVVIDDEIQLLRREAVVPR